MNKMKALPPLLESKNLRVYYPITKGVLRRAAAHVHALESVSLAVHSGEILSIVGESGCGKSTFARAVLGLHRATSGEIKLEGQQLDLQNSSAFQKYRPNFQIIFQDPYLALNPRHTVLEILSEALLFHKLASPKDIKEKVALLLEKVGLDPEQMYRYPHAFSGGQRQRICIARAISLEPKLIICDEIVSALDLSVQAQIVQLLLKLKKEFKLALLWISHDLSLVRHISDRVAVMYLGRIVEMNTAASLFAKPAHPYTKALIEAIPGIEPGQKPRVLKGEPPSAAELPSGCVFHPRCPRVQAKCKTQSPPLTGNTETQLACFNPTPLDQAPNS